MRYVAGLRHHLMTGTLTPQALREWLLLPTHEFDGAPYLEHLRDNRLLAATNLRSRLIILHQIGVKLHGR